MDTLKEDLKKLNDEIQKLESYIKKAEREAEDNIKPLKEEFSKVKEDKRNFASKNDFDSVQICRRRENNLKFKIDAQWNRYSLLKENLTKLNKRKRELESKIKLEDDKIRRNNEILRQMDKVLRNYKKSQSLKQAAIDSNINPHSVQQWYDWGRDNLNEIYSHFYKKIKEIDNYFKELKSKELKDKMDCVVEAYKNTHSLKDASKIANVNPDTVQYWYDWGSRGFGEENTYFFKKIDEIEN